MDNEEISKFSKNSARDYALLLNAPLDREHHARREEFLSKLRARNSEEAKLSADNAKQFANAFANRLWKTNAVRDSANGAIRGVMEMHPGSLLASAPGLVADATTYFGGKPPAWLDAMPSYDQLAEAPHGAKPDSPDYATGYTVGQLGGVLQLPGMVRDAANLVKGGLNAYRKYIKPVAPTLSLASSGAAGTWAAEHPAATYAENDALDMSKALRARPLAAAAAGAATTSVDSSARPGFAKGGSTEEHPPIDFGQLLLNAAARHVALADEY
jgi:hypothetical protein